jgi:hypothetical protein
VVESELAGIAGKEVTKDWLAEVSNPTRTVQAGSVN